MCKAFLLWLSLLMILCSASAAWAVSPVSTDRDSTAALRKSPLKAVFLSAVFPGGGQIYTRNYWKAAALGATETALAGAALYQVWQMNRATSQAEIDSHFETQRSLWWWTAGVWAFSLADAYVDAQLYKFDEQGKVAVRLNPGKGLLLVLAKDL
jgi:hypothetical protein